MLAMETWWTKPHWSTQRGKKLFKETVMSYDFWGAHIFLPMQTQSGDISLKGLANIQGEMRQRWTGVSSLSGHQATGRSEGQEQVSAPSLPFSPIFILFFCTSVGPPVLRYYQHLCSCEFVVIMGIEECHQSISHFIFLSQQGYF